MIESKPPKARTSLTRGMAGITLAALSGTAITSVLVTITSAIEGGTSLNGAAEFLGIVLMFSFPIALMMGILLGVPVYLVARRFMAMSILALTVLGTAAGGISGLIVAAGFRLGTPPFLSFSLIGAIAGLGAAIAWWFSVERSRYPNGI
jgi:hypothetical protein